LLGSCRLSYHSLGRELGVTCPTIKSRVDRLRQMGVIQRFSVELSQEALGLQWVMSELRTNMREKKEALLKSFEAHECTMEVLMLGGGRYLVFAEVLPEENNDYSRCLKELNDVEYIEASKIEPVPTSQLHEKCMFATRGGAVTLNRNEVTVLRALVNNARASIKRVSEITGYGSKQVRRIIYSLSRCRGVFFTIMLNLPSCGEINVILRTRIRDKRATPCDLATWMCERFPEEHWFTFHSPQTDELMHYMTTKSFSDIDRIVHETSLQDGVEDIRAEIIHSAMRYAGRTEQFLKNNGLESINGVVSHAA